MSLLVRADYHRISFALLNSAEPEIMAIEAGSSIHKLIQDQHLDDRFEGNLPKPFRFYHQKEACDRRGTLKLQLAAISISAAFFATSVPAQIQPHRDVISSKPTIDCLKAHTPLALILCSGRDAANADWEVSAASWAYAASLEDSARKSLWQEQDNWVKSISVTCKLALAASVLQRQCVVNV